MFTTKFDTLKLEVAAELARLIEESRIKDDVIAQKTAKIEELLEIIAAYENNTPDPDPVPDPVYKGIFVGTDEIMRLSTEKDSWKKVLGFARANWGEAKLFDNNSIHDVAVLAGALVAVRLKDEAMRAKVIGGLQSAMRSTLSRTLELSRGFQAYVIAADLIGYRDPAFLAWVERMVFHVFDKDDTHSGYQTIFDTAKFLWNNWSMHARSSVLAAGLFLNKPDWIKMVLDAHRQLIGLTIEKPYKVNYKANGWIAGTPVAGVNVRGATIQGKNVSGVLHQDWLRGTYAFQWPPEPTGYMWEGMQGFVSTAIMLHRAGLLDFSAGDNAVVRAMNMLYGMGEAAANNPRYVNPAAGDDSGIPWAVNWYAGTDFPTTEEINAGKGLGYYQWLSGN